MKRGRTASFGATWQGCSSIKYTQSRCPGSMRQQHGVSCMIRQNDPGLYYFAYGANMSREVLKRRHVQPRLSVPAELAPLSRTCDTLEGDIKGRDTSAQEGGPVVACAHRSGYMTLLLDSTSYISTLQDKEPGNPFYFQPVCGVLHELESEDDFLRIEAREVGYYWRWVTVTVPKGPGIECHGLLHELEREVCQADGMGDEKDTMCVVKARAFVSSQWLLLKTPVPPTHRYKSILVDGARYHHVNPAYMQWLEQLQSVDTRQLSQKEYSDCPAEYGARGVVCLILMVLWCFTSMAL